MPGFTYETLCHNCGKPLRREMLRDNRDRKFCNRQCYREYHDKKKALAEKYKVSHTMTRPMTRPKTPEEQCKKCRYGNNIGGTWGCSYFEITGHTRHSIHPEGLPEECQEFQRMKRGRKPKSMTIKQN